MVVPFPPKTLGQRMRWLRSVGDISARELDRLAGKTPGHALSIETKLGDGVELRTIAKYATVLGVSLDWLWSGQGPEPTEASVCEAIAAAKIARAKRTSRAPKKTKRTTDPGR